MKAGASSFCWDNDKGLRRFLSFNGFGFEQHGVDAAALTRAASHARAAELGFDYRPLRQDIAADEVRVSGVLNDCEYFGFFSFPCFWVYDIGDIHTE